jgi:hypothetical protein
VLISLKTVSVPPLNFDPLSLKGLELPRKGAGLGKKKKKKQREKGKEKIILSPIPHSDLLCPQL